jgi:DNA invertase Pin-like site-specific DNA recombinase
MKPREERRAAIYARVSTIDQKLELQRDEAREIINRRGWKFMRVYEDHGASGATRERRGLEELLRDARRRYFDVLVVWRSDRLFRSVHEMVVTLEEFAALGVDFISVTEPFDTSTPTGKLLLLICTAFAQFERDIMIERTVAGMAAAVRRGKRMGRPPTRIDLERAAELLAEGRSTRDVARELGTAGTTLRRALRKANGNKETAPR